MFGLTALETRLIAYAFILVGIAGYTAYERYQGAASCVAHDNSAELAQAQKERQDAHTTIATLQQQLAALPDTVPDAAPLRMCNAPARVPSGAATARVEPQSLPDYRSDPRMQTGNKPGSDIGGAVQDITLASVLCTTNAQDLWQLAIKESTR